MYFDSLGPFELARNKGNRWRSDFWKEVETARPGLSTAVGCYMFTLAARNKVRPWYVGQTLAVQGYQGEIFQKHKLDHYDRVMSKHRGTGQIILFPLVDSDGFRLRRARKSTKSLVDWLERTLIGMALASNPNISNSRETKFHRDVYVNGILGTQWPGVLTRGAKFARGALLKRSSDDTE